MNKSPLTPQSPAGSSDETAAREFGRVDDNGTIWVKDGQDERAVGQFPEDLPADPLQLFVRRYLDLKSQIDLFAERLHNLNVKEIDQTLQNLADLVKEPAVVGDIPALRTRLAELKEQGEAAKEANRQRRIEAKQQATLLRTDIVERAEAVAGQDPQQTQWKHSSQALRDLLEEWKSAQRNGPRLDRGTEDALWKRFSAARTTFDRHRRQFFSQLDASQAEAKRTKEKLVARAEELSTSTDWGPTAGAYRDLMNQWRRAGRAARKDDDALWKRFRTAQQLFFDAKNAQDAALDEEFANNLVVKEEILVRAEALLPITDVAVAKEALRPLQDAWDAAGMVPRKDKARIEARMRDIEEAVRAAEDAEWRRTNPETKARAEGLLAQLEEQLAELTEKLNKAKERGDQQAIKKLEESLTARTAWFEQIKSTASK
ncbi:MAG: DUF349 domain-containing protein [Actinomycetaceae bacterium]|nr:DUF349 domain-containing protein [Actinomycetaceae bacterium]